jgi:DNA (cytosine-5)-methyltransferase 1
MGGLNELALFAGAGGGILGGLLLGWHTVAAVEIDPYCREVLLRRQLDGCIPLFPIWDDVRTFDGRPWRGLVDVISGGFPCQDISCAGKGAGLEGVRSGLWSEFARIIREVRPRFVFVENSPELLIRGFGIVIGDLANMGYGCRWGVFSACSVGAPHMRRRLFVLANADDFDGKTRMGAISPRTESIWGNDDEERQNGPRRVRLETSAAGSRMADGLAMRMVRGRSIGNGQVPAVARLAWEVLISKLQEKSTRATT